MDIFTTQLTRVVPVPIKPTSLKVKALLKDAASTKLKEDHDHIENHEYYFEQEKAKGEQYHQGNQEKSELNAPENNESLATAPTNEEVQEKDQHKKNTGKDKHLDLYA